MNARTVFCGALPTPLRKIGEDGFYCGLLPVAASRRQIERSGAILIQSAGQNWVAGVSSKQLEALGSKLMLLTIL
jgi:hypothetical protein